MTCLHNHDQILEFLQKIFLKGFQIYQNYLCALTNDLYLFGLRGKSFFPLFLFLQISSPSLSAGWTGATPHIPTSGGLYHSEHP